MAQKSSHFYVSVIRVLCSLFVCFTDSIWAWTGRPLGDCVWRLRGTHGGDKFPLGRVLLQLLWLIDLCVSLVGGPCLTGIQDSGEEDDTADTQLHCKTHFCSPTQMSAASHRPHWLWQPCYQPHHRCEDCETACRRGMWTFPHMPVSVRIIPVMTCFHVTKFWPNPTKSFVLGYSFRLCPFDQFFHL